MYSAKLKIKYFKSQIIKYESTAGINENLAIELRKARITKAVPTSAREV